MRDHEGTVTTKTLFVECVGFHRVVEKDTIYDPCENCTIETRADFLNAAVEEFGRVVTQAQDELERRYREAGLLDAE